MLFERTITVTGGSFLMHNNYANVLKNSGKVEKAIEHYLPIGTRLKGASRILKFGKRLLVLILPTECTSIVTFWTKSGGIAR